MPRLSRKQLAARNKLRYDNGNFVNFNNEDTQEEDWSVWRNDILEAQVNTENAEEAPLRTKIRESTLVEYTRKILVPQSTETERKLRRLIQSKPCSTSVILQHQKRQKKLN